MSQCFLSSAISVSNLFICCLSSPQIFTKVINCSVTARRHSIICLLVPSTDSSLQCFIAILELVEHILIVCYDDWCWKTSGDISRIWPLIYQSVRCQQNLVKKNLIFCKMLAVSKSVYLTCPASGQPRSSAPGSTGRLGWQSGIWEQKPPPEPCLSHWLSLSYWPEEWGDNNNNKTQLWSWHYYAEASGQ